MLQEYFYCTDEDDINDFDDYYEYSSSWDPIIYPLESAEDAAAVEFDYADGGVWPKRFWLKRDEFSTPIGPIEVDCEPVPKFHATSL